VALVERGRAGPDVVVHDQAIKLPIPIKVKKMPTPNTPAARRVAIDAAITDIKTKLGTDHAAELEYLQALALDACAKPKQAEDETDEAYAARLKKLEDEEAKEKKEGKEEPDAHKKEKPTMDKQVMDAAIGAAVALARAETETATIAKLNAIRQAEKEVAPFVGEVGAMDSAEAVYKLALDEAKIDLSGVPTAAYRAMAGMLRKPSDIKPERFAMDAAHGDAFATLYGKDSAPLVRTL
jgi:hypothetical protein